MAEEEASPAKAAAQSTTGGIKGFLTGTVAGAAVSAAIGVVIGAVAGPVINWMSGREGFSGMTAHEAAQASADKIDLHNEVLRNSTLADAKIALDSSAKAGFVGPLDPKMTVQEAIKAGHFSEAQVGIQTLPTGVDSSSLGLNQLYAPAGVAGPADLSYKEALQQGVIKAAEVPIASAHTGATFGQAIGQGATTGGVLGGMFGGIAGTLSGMFTGWRNVNKADGGTNGLAQEQAKQMEFAKGVAQGVTMAKVEQMQEEAASSQWAGRVGRNSRGISPDAIREQQAALAAMEPQGRA